MAINLDNLTHPTPVISVTHAELDTAQQEDATARVGMQAQIDQLVTGFNKLKEQLNNVKFIPKNFDRSSTVEFFEDDYIKLRWNTNNEQLEVWPKSTAPVAWGWLDRIIVKVDGSSQTFRAGGDDAGSGADQWYQLAVDTANIAQENYGSGAWFMIHKESYSPDYPQYTGTVSYGGSNVHVNIQANYPT